MAGNRRAYESAIQRAAELAQSRRWTGALEEYNKALAEFPQDVAALTGLGLAYVETRQLEKALHTYQQVARLSPDNPEVIQRVGQVLEHLAQWPEAARTYVRAADAYLRLRDVSQAVELWQKAVILDPENLEAHRNLSKAYQSQQDVRRAARHNLIIARVLATKGRIDEAITYCRAALQWDPRSTEAQGILDALRQGVPLPDGPTARLQPDAEGKRTLDSFVVFEDIELETAALLGDQQRFSPSGFLREHLLTQMAEAIFSDTADPDRMKVNLLLGQAADLQTRGMTDKAIDAYLGALGAGADTAAVRFNLGLLYLDKGEYARALEHLSHTLRHAEYALGTHFAIGECYQAWGKPHDALRHLLQALLVLESQMVPASQVKALEAAYEELLRPQARRNGSGSEERTVRSIVSFLSAKGWGQQLIEARQQLDSLAEGELLITVAETLAEPQGVAAIASMKQIQEHMQQGLMFTALEEALWGIQQAPYYLPLHIRLADALMEAERLDEAVQKYIIVAETYRIRGDIKRSIAIHRYALKIAPMDISLREKLIEMLLEANMIDQAIEQYIAAADVYYQLAQVDQAIAQYNQALHYVSSGDPSRQWERNILHRIGDIHMQRVEWTEALRVYRRIKRLDPEDERARGYLADLHLKLGQRDQALRELDELIDFCTTHRQLQKVLPVLQEFTLSEPQDLALHMRLAKLYVDLQMKDEAISELDTVGELQLGAGMTQEAARTIQAIIRLGPGNVQGYRQLLDQLERQL